MPEYRECITCGETKGIDSFRQYSKTVGSGPLACRKTYRHTKCRECEREYARKRSFEARRGITHEERDEMLAEQGGRCAACGTDSPGSQIGWHVDHCHETDEIRGILCHHCNAALGHAQDDTQRLSGLILYLRGVKYADAI